MKNFYTFLIAILVSGLGFGQDSQVLAPTTQISAGSISSLANTATDAVDIFSFKINERDDAFATTVTKITLISSANNTALWSNTIAGVTVEDVDYTGTDITIDSTDPLSQSIEITFPSSGPGSLTIGNNTSPDITVGVYLQSAVTDGEVISFSIAQSNTLDEFESDPSGSQFETLFAASINGNDFTIAVVATKLTMLQQPTDVVVGSVMSPSVQVAFTDTTGNVDLDVNDSSGLGLEVLGGTTFFSGSSTSVEVSDGIGTFNNLIFTVSAFSIFRVQNLAVPGIPNIFSGPFNVTPFPGIGDTYRYNSTETDIVDGGWVLPEGNPNGVSQGNDVIEIESGNANITDDTNIYNVLVKPGASLTVETGITLTVINNMTLESSSTSYSSFIFNGIRPNPNGGTVVGSTINYKRFVNANSNGNDLISAPLKGEGSSVNGIGWQDFLATGTNSSDLLSQVQGTVTAYAFAPFVKSSTDDYVNYTSATLNSVRLNSGIGFRVATVADDPDPTVTGIGRTLTFSGDIRTATVAVGVFFEPGPFADWNLIGNPYPSYISVEEFFTSTVGNPIQNIDRITLLSGIYGYDATSAGGIWDIITLANINDDGDRLIAPGQGFLIPAAATGVPGVGGTFSNSVYFDNTMRSTGSSDDFILGRDASAPIFLKLNASTADKNYKTQFYFNENASLGGDHGYDGRVLGTPPNFALYSHLVQDNTGLPIALQALNPSDLVETTVIPLGVNSNQGEQITFSILESSLPDTIEVYLEDTVTNTFTLLNSGDYTLTPNVALNGTGRFYLRFGEGALSTTETTLADLNIFTNQNDKTIVIAGQLLEPTTASIYDIQGRLVNTTPLATTSRSQNIDVSNLSSGVYVVQLNNGTQNKTQKVILR